MAWVSCSQEASDLDIPDIPVQAKCVLAVVLWGFVQMVNVGLLNVVSRGALWVSPLGQLAEEQDPVSPEGARGRCLV